MPANLANRLRRIMKAKGWSRADLARAAGGVSRQTVSRWLNDGLTQMDAKSAYSLEDESGFSAKWILLGVGPVDAVSLARDMLRRHASRDRDTREK